MDILQALIDLVSNVGFPIAISVYLLHHFDKKMDRLVDSLEDLLDWLKNNLKGN